MLPIYHYEKQTLIDYPGHIAATIFLSGCNFHCPFCHNSELIEFHKAKLSVEEILTDLKRRSRFLEGVVITGGEPTLFRQLIPLLAALKDLGLKVKLDTNGSRPDLLAEIIEFNLVDYIAMDIKDSLVNYVNFTKEKDIKVKILRSIELIKKSGVEHEFRTTVVQGKIGEDEIKDISKSIEGSKYFLQKFYPSKTLNLEFKKISSTPKELLNVFKDIASAKVCCDIRGA